MIQRFVNRNLPALEVIYGIEGARSRTDELDLGPIQLVHDVSRETEAAQGFEYFVPVSLGPTGGAGVRIFAGADAFPSPTTQADQLGSRNLELNELDVWLMGIALLETAASAGNLGQASAGVLYPAGVVFPGVTAELALALWPSTSLSIQLVNGGDGWLGVAGNIAFPFGPQKYPLKLTQGANLVVTAFDDAGGAWEGTFFFRLWAAPKGSFPPGL